MALTPGLEVRIGGVTVVAESMRLVALRSFLARLLGWHRERIEAVDLALRAVRIAATRQARLVVSGEEDLVPIAHGIHLRALGPSKPFIACDPRRRRTEATARSVANIDVGMDALQAAEGGSLCVRSQRLPRDFPEVTAALRDPARRVQLIICTHDESESRRLAATTAVDIPPLSSRPDEIGHVIDEYAADAAAALDAKLLRVRVGTASMRSVTLDGAFVTDCDFARANLDRTLWVGTMVVGSTFDGAVMTDARLGDALFVECSFRGVDFSSINLGTLATAVGAIFVRCDMRESGWDARDLDGVSMVDCMLSGVHGARCAISPRPDDRAPRHLDPRDPGHRHRGGRAAQLDRILTARGLKDVAAVATVAPRCPTSDQREHGAPGRGRAKKRGFSLPCEVSRNALHPRARR
jgi:hypothetical protein